VSSGVRLSRVESEAGKPLEQGIECEGSMISPVVSVMPSWAQIVISSNVET
jgi:hypothetical protein